MESNHCALLSAEEGTPKIFTLDLHRGERRKVLQHDSVLYRSRYCPYDYGIYRVYALGSNSYRKLVITDKRQEITIVHQGTFVYNITDPLNPREIDYQADFTTND